MSGEEVWKPLPQSEGQVELSSHGRIRRLVERGRPVNPPRIAKPVVMTRGYSGVSFSAGGRHQTLSLQHSLLCAFVAPPPSDRHRAVFIDGDKNNFALDNLQWATFKERHDLRRIHGRHQERAHKVIDGEIHYQCIYCAEWKPRDGFYKFKGGFKNGEPLSAVGISSDCKNCSNKHRAERRRAKAAKPQSESLNGL